MTSTIQVARIFRTLHNTGPLAGHPTVMVEVDDRRGAGMTAEEILAWAEDVADAPTLITFTGNDPVLQPLGDLILMGQAQGHTIAVETRGHVAPAWLDDLDHLIVSPTPPSVGLPTDWKTLHHVVGAGLAGRPKLSLVITVADDADFEFSEMINALFPPIDIYVVPAVVPGSNGPFGLIERARWIAEMILDRQLPDFRISLPIRPLIWGHASGR